MRNNAPLSLALALFFFITACAKDINGHYFSQAAVQQDIANARAIADKFIAKVKADVAAFKENAPMYEAEAKAAIGFLCDAMPLIASVAASATSTLNKPPKVVIQANSGIAKTNYVTNQSCTAYRAVAQSTTPPTPIDTLNQAVGLANAYTAAHEALKTIQKKVS